MPIKAATTRRATSSSDAREQTIKINFGCSKATLTRTPNNFKTVAKGDGIAAVAVAIPIHRDGRQPKRAWRVLLDSGSDGDLIFTKNAEVKNINPIKRTHPLVWGTSNGDFKTTKVGDVELKFPEFHETSYSV